MPKRRERQDGLVCCIKGCNSHLYCKGMCQKHYMRFHRTGSPELRKVPRTEICVQLGCREIPARRNMCWSHYQAWLDERKTLTPTPVIQLSA